MSEHLAELGLSSRPQTAATSPLYEWADIRTLHIEATSRCNARCPMCARNQSGGAPNPRVPISDLHLADFERMLPANELAHLERVYFCGNYGDPAAARDLLEVTRYLRHANPALKLSFHSNGGLRSNAWWREMAGVVSHVRFGIDGLEDTNHLYRQGVVWSKLIANLTAFIQAGGQAEVDFLVFRHNEHQVEAAERFFRDLGAKHVSFKTTSRFFRFRTAEWIDSFPVKDFDGNFSHDLRPPIGNRWQNPTRERMHQLVARHGSLENYYDSAAIQCRVQVERSAYLTAEGFVLPCCWVAGEFYNSTHHAHAGQMRELVESSAGAWRAINARETPMAEVFRAEIFQRTLPQSWRHERIRDGKPLVCAKTCGAELKPFENQFR